MPPAAGQDAADLPRRRLSRARQNERRRELLLTAAWEVLAERGYQATTLEEVAQRAGFTRQPIYTLFGSKQRLALALYEQVLGHFQDRIQAITPGPTLEATLIRYADLLTELSKAPEFKTQSELASMLAALSWHDEDIRAGMGEVLKRDRAGLLSWVQACADATGGSFRIPVESVAAILGAAMAGLLRMTYVEPDLGHPQLKYDLVRAFVD